MPIPRYPADAPLEEISAALEDAGCVVVSDLMDSSLRQLISDELAPHMSKARVIEDDDPEEFYPGRTRRISALVCALSQRYRPPDSTPVDPAGLRNPPVPNSEHGYQLHVSAALEVGPGAREQVLHREEDSFTFFPLPRPNIIVGQHVGRYGFPRGQRRHVASTGQSQMAADRKAKPKEILSAEMPAGAVLYWMGGLLHGAGANTSRDWRYGVILTYSLGWVRQEENQYLDVPRERWRSYHRK